MPSGLIAAKPWWKAWTFFLIPQSTHYNHEPAARGRGAAAEGNQNWKAGKPKLEQRGLFAVGSVAAFIHEMNVKYSPGLEIGGQGKKLTINEKTIKARCEARIETELN